MSRMNCATRLREMKDRRRRKRRSREKWRDSRRNSPRHKYRAEISTRPVSKNEQKHASDRVLHQRQRIRDNCSRICGALLLSTFPYQKASLEWRSIGNIRCNRVGWNFVLPIRGLWFNLVLLPCFSSPFYLSPFFFRIEQLMGRAQP